MVHCLLFVNNASPRNLVKMMQRRREAPSSGESNASFIRELPLKEEIRETIKGKKQGRLPRFNFYCELLLVVVTSVAMFPLILILPFFVFTSKVATVRKLRSGCTNRLDLKHEDVARSVISADTGSV